MTVATRPDVRPVRAEEVAALAASLRRARERRLARMDVAAVVDVLDEVARRWSGERSAPRAEAMALLPRTTGFSPAMVGRLVDAMFASLTGPRLRELLDEELGGPEPLDGFAPRRAARGTHRAFGPELVAEVLGGADPTLPALSLARTLLLRSALMARVPAAEPVFPALLVRSLAEVDPGVAEAVALLSWPASEEGVTAAVLHAADGVVASGSDATIAQLRAIAGAGTRIVAYGDRIGAALAGREALTRRGAPALARALADDVAAAEGLGCLAPGVVYAERGGEVDPVAFGRLTLDALDALADRLPPGPAPLGARARLAHERLAAAMAASSAGDAEVFTRPGRGTVVVGGGSAPTSGSGHRTVRVCPVDDLDAALDALDAARPLVATIALAGAGVRTPRVCDALGRARVARVCRFGTMAAPPLTWHHDGAPRLLGLLHWIDVDLDEAPQ